MSREDRSGGLTSDTVFQQDLLDNQPLLPTLPKRQLPFKLPAWAPSVWQQRVAGAVQVSVTEVGA